LCFRSDFSTICGVVAVISNQWESGFVSRLEHQCMTIHLGYLRVSTEKQGLDMQLAALTPLCGNQLWHEKKSGMSQAGRTELAAVLVEAKRLKLAGEDVCICVYSLSRLGRRLVETVSLIEDLQKAGIGFKSTSESIDTTTAMGRCFLNIIASIGQMEAELTSERTVAALQAKKAAGVILGRRREGGNDQDVERAKALIESGCSLRTAAKEIGMNHSTLIRILKKAS
jgi:DNA invertase Pin-like site-specific DNA recombinase